MSFLFQSLVNDSIQKRNDNPDWFFVAKNEFADHKYEPIKLPSAFVYFNKDTKILPFTVRKIRITQQIIIYNY